MQNKIDRCRCQCLHFGKESLKIGCVDSGKRSRTVRFYWGSSLVRDHDFLKASIWARVCILMLESDFNFCKQVESAYPILANVEKVSSSLDP